MSSIVKYAKSCVFLISIMLTMASSQVRAHEFWLEPEPYKDTGPLTLNFYNGEGFAGRKVSMHAESTRRLTLHNAGRSTALDMPSDNRGSYSVTVPKPRAGTSVIVFESSPTLHRYENFQEFKTFTTAEGLDWAVGQHRRRQLPDDYFSEIVKRYTKTLICRGEPTGSDQVLGLDVELTAMFNPFAQHDANDRSVENEQRWSVQLTLDQQAAKDHQITLFHRNASGQINLHRLKTDRNGVAKIPRLGQGDYLLNAVNLRTPSIRNSLRYGAVWESRWSTLLFSVGKHCNEAGYTKSTGIGITSNPLPNG